jgi:hypothetical protein
MATEASRKWMQGAADRMKKKGTVGSMDRLARQAGESPREFAISHYHAAGKVGEKARFAANAQGWK